MLPALSINDSEAGAKSNLPAIDGLRGLSILAVVFHHFGIYLPGWLDWGPVGPSVFFMLSGFFITQSLWRIQQTGHPVWPAMLRFHSRRFFRLAPSIAVLLLIGAALGIEEHRETWYWHMLFLSNFLVVFRAEWIGSLSHLWSLAVQEQFYLLWTLILFVPRSRFAQTMLILCLCALLFRTVCIVAGSSEFARWLLLPGSLDAFAVGGLAAWLHQRGTRLWVPPPALRHLPLCAAIASLVLSRFLRFLPDTHLGTAWVEIFESAFFLWLLLHLLRTPSSRLAATFCWKPLVFLGRLSFGIFVFHTLIAVAVGRFFFFESLASGPRQLVYAGSLVVLSTLVAMASRTVLEAPVQQWASKLPPIPNAGQISSWLAAIRRIRHNNVAN